MTSIRALAPGFILFLAACSGGWSGAGTTYDGSPALPVPNVVGGPFKMLHSFSSNNDGAHPESDLIAVNGVLYGTTTDGGTSSSKCSCGTVFSIDSSGNEKVIYR